MALLINTSTIAPGDRDDALSALISSASGPMRVTHDVDDELIRNQTHHWNLGPNNGLIRLKDNAVRFTRTARDLRADDRELFAVTYQHHGSSTSRDVSGVETKQAKGTLSLHNVASAHDFAFDGVAENASFLVSHEDLGLPVSLVIDSAPKTRFSPLYALVRADFARLSGVADELSDDEAASTLLAESMVPLIRALVASTDLENRQARDAAHETRYAALVAQARHHLDDPRFDEETLAAMSHNSAGDVRAARSQTGASIADWMANARSVGTSTD